jgi:hypothetical protein
VNGIDEPKGLPDFFISRAGADAPLVAGRP